MFIVVTLSLFPFSSLPSTPLSLSSRVHISESTLQSLNGAYDVEPGNGIERDDYLKKNHVTTYLIIEKV